MLSVLKSIKLARLKFKIKIYKHKKHQKQKILKITKNVKMGISEVVKFRDFYIFSFKILKYFYFKPRFEYFIDFEAENTNFESILGLKKF